MSIPDDVFEAGERASRKLRVSRSQFYADAVRAYARKHSGEEITRQLDAVHAGNESAIEPEWEAESLDVLAQERWSAGIRLVLGL